MSNSADELSLPAAPLERLLSAPAELGSPLPEPFATVYGRWDIPTRNQLPYVYVNFIVSRDGRISFNEPGNVSPRPLSRGNEHDPWLMGLLRARADAVLVGDSTARIEPEHVWTPEFIYPAGAAAFDRLRRAEGLGNEIPLVLLSLEGEIDPKGAALQHDQAVVVIATTSRGEARAKRLVDSVPARVDVRVLGDVLVDPDELMRLLYGEYGVRRLLCEGGPRVYGSLLAAGVVDDEFLTLSPVVVGNDANGPARSALIEGARFSPNTAPASRLLSVHRDRDYLYLRSRYLRRDAPPVAPAN